jgi:hypothetical protein
VYKHKIILNVGTTAYNNEFLNSVTCKSIIWVIKEFYHIFSQEGNNLKLSESK